MSIYTIYWLRDNTHTDPYIEGYVGVTTRDPQHRLNEHLISKEYIPDTYVFDILRQVDTKEEMLSIERLYRPTDHIGWNIAKGGGARPAGIHTSGWSHTEESKEQRRIAVMGESNPMYGKTITDEHKESIRVANSVPKPYVSKNMKRLHEEGKTYKFSKKDCGARPVIADGVRYESLTDACKAFGFKNHNSGAYRIKSLKWDWNYEE